MGRNRLTCCWSILDVRDTSSVFDEAVTVLAAVSETAAQEDLLPRVVMEVRALLLQNANGRALP